MLPLPSCFPGLSKPQHHSNNQHSITIHILLNPSSHIFNLQPSLLISTKWSLDTMSQAFHTCTTLPVAISFDKSNKSLILLYLIYPSEISEDIRGLHPFGYGLRSRVLPSGRILSESDPIRSVRSPSQWTLLEKPNMTAVNVTVFP
jgi:hypothetical protein